MFCVLMHCTDYLSHSPSQSHYSYTTARTRARGGASATCVRARPARAPPPCTRLALRLDGRRRKRRESGFAPACSVRSARGNRPEARSKDGPLHLRRHELVVERKARRARAAVPVAEPVQRRDSVGPASVGLRIHRRRLVRHCHHRGPTAPPTADGAAAPTDRAARRAERRAEGRAHPRRSSDNPRHRNRGALPHLLVLGWGGGG